MALAVTLIGFLGATCNGAPVSTPRIIVDHPTALIDAPLSVRVAQLRPGAEVTVQARMTDGSGNLWTASATFISGPGGSIDLSTARPEPGSSYPNADAMGLLWSLRPRQSPRLGPSVDEPSSEQVTLTAGSGGATSAPMMLTRLTTAAGVTKQQLTVSGQGFYGRLYSPPTVDADTRPAVLLFGGSEGGLSTALEAGLLASHGYPTLALAYFAAPGLPPNLVRIPLEYFAGALAWLERQAGVDTRRVTVIGESRGTEAALLLGTRFPDLVHAVAAYSPSSVVNPGLTPHGAVADPAWTLDKQAVPTVKLSEYRDPSPAGDPKAIIPVERIRGPVLLVSGSDDRLWPSPWYAAAIVARLEAANYPFPHHSLLYEGDGHGVASPVPYRPVAPPLLQTQYGQLDLGGSQPANARALADSWPKLLQFLASA